MGVFAATLGQTVFLFLFVLMGHFFARKKRIPEDAQTVLVSHVLSCLTIPGILMLEEQRVGCAPREGGCL